VAGQAAVVRVEAEPDGVGEVAAVVRVVVRAGAAAEQGAADQVEVEAEAGAVVVEAVDADSACGSAKPTVAVAQSTMGFWPPSIDRVTPVM